MAGNLGRLLIRALERIDQASDPSEKRAVAAAYGGGSAGDEVPVVIQIPLIKPKPGEDWQAYRARVQIRLEPLAAELEQVMGIESIPLFTGNALQASASPEQIARLGRHDGIELLELDPLVKLTEMDDVPDDLDYDTFHTQHPTLNGKDVTVAVIDSGVDTVHPHLNVSDSVSTCGEPFDLPGAHGTHCAGSVASKDSRFRGIAPGVTLLNIKVLRADGSGRHTFIVNGIDEAMNRDAQVLSLSIGFNHLPTWSQAGHGWACPDGRCPLCRAVDNASLLDSALVVVAAANEHSSAESLRQWGFGATFDTELGCPGQAREALTVGAITKKTFLPASFSSRGPTAYGAESPDICAPGVNITSTVPQPRDASGQPIPNPPRSHLFGRMSGTSMATPIVAGAAALVIQRAVEAGSPWTPASVKRDLMNAAEPLPYPRNVAGAGRLNLERL